MKLSTSEQHDPLEILGVESHASEQEVRQRYLALVKLYPPETHAVKFREIHQAYESVKDPLVLAQRLLAPVTRLPKWDEVIEQEARRPPNLNADLLIALGNRSQTQTSQDNKRVDAPHE